MACTRPLNEIELKIMQDQIPVRLLKGNVAGWCGKSIIDLFFFKRTVREWMFRKMDAYSWPSSIKTRMREVLADVKACRANLAPADQTGFFQIDTTEHATWPESADKYLLTAESLVYGYQHDLAEIKIMTQKRGVEDLMELAEIAHFMREVEAAHQKDRTT